MPVAQYPELAPPQVTVSAFYTGANAQAVETAVTTPLEQAINGVEGMLYMSSSSTNAGVSQITVTFDVTRDVDLAAVDVQNRVNQALGRMPAEVRTTGVTVQKASTNFVLGAGVYSENGRIRLAVHEQLHRRLRQGRAQALPGVGEVLIFGERKYSMRALARSQPAGGPRRSPPATWSTRCASRTSRWRPAASARRRRARDRATRSASAPRGG